MNIEDLESLVMDMDTKDSQVIDANWEKIKSHKDIVMQLFKSKYPLFRRAEGRRALMFYATSYSRAIIDAFDLGIMGLNDRSSLVRYRACGVLASSLNGKAIPYLKLLVGHKDKKTSEDALAAIDAISSKNHNYFIDRSHTGKIMWTFI